MAHTSAVICDLCSGGDLAPSLGGREKFSRTKISIFTAKISDDPFLVIDQAFRIFPLSFHTFSVSLLCKMSYMTLSSQEKHLFFTLFRLSRASDNTTSQNIGGTDA